MMKTTAAILTAGLLLTAALPALADGDPGELPPALRRGANALQFQISNSFRLTSFRGAAVSYQRLLGDRLGLRIGLTLRGDHDTRDESFDFGEEGAATAGGDFTNWSHEYVLSLKLLAFQGEAPLTFFYGAGPTVSYESLRNDRASYYPQPDGTIDTVWRQNESETWGVGVTGVAGAQWLLTDFLAVHAEYRATFVYEVTNWTEEQTVSGDSSYDLSGGGKTKSPELKSDGVLFGLSVFF
jgi:opacity protein-like surface antigen